MMKALLFFYLPGAAWRWLVAIPGMTRGPRWLVAAAESVLLSVCFTLPMVLVLGGLNLFRPALARIVITIILLAGVLLGSRRGIRAWIGNVVDALPGLVAAALILAGGYLLPERGEWILGGCGSWDCCCLPCRACVRR